MVRSVADRAFLPAKNLLEEVGDMMILTGKTIVSALRPPYPYGGEFLGLAVTDETGKPFLGHVMLHTLDFRHRRGEIGYWLVPSARGQGNGKAAVSLLVEWAFARLDLERLEITTTPENTAARALAGSLGFAEEGIMRARNVERGRRVDIVLLARLRK